MFSRPAQSIAGAVRSTDENFTLPLIEEIEIAARDSGRGVSTAQSGLVRVYAFGTALAMLAVIVAFVWIEV
jgi:hypothetical protein